MFTRPPVLFHSIDVEGQPVPIGLRRNLTEEAHISINAIKCRLQRRAFVISKGTRVNTISPGIALFGDDSPICVTMKLPVELDEIARLESFCVANACDGRLLRGGSEINRELDVVDPDGVIARGIVAILAR